MHTESSAARLTSGLLGVLVAVLLVPSSLQAAAWHRLYATVDRCVDIDLAGMRQHKGVVLTWVRFSFVEAQQDSSARSYRSVLQQWAYQCAAGRHALMQFAEFSDGAGAGKLVAADSRDRYEWSYPEPHSLGAAAMKLACAQTRDSSARLARSPPKRV